MSDGLPPGATFRLFVYGTLKRGGVRYAPLDGQRFLGEATTRPLYALHDLGSYPGLVADTSARQAVAGELYEVQRRLLTFLDEVEGSPSWFRLEPVEIEGQPGPVFAYFYQQSPTGRPRIASGRWENRAVKGGP